MKSQFQKLTVEQLAMNGHFQQWVKHPNEKLNTFWSSWIGENPERRELAEEARRLVISIDFEDDLADAEIGEEWAKMQAIIQQPDKEKEIITPGLSRTRPLLIYWRVAAVFIALLISVVVLYTFFNQPQQIEYATGYGDVRTVNLPDGSTIILNANSKVRFSQNWNSEVPREVWLDGEAYFLVTHQANHQKFIVRTSDPFSVEVLGTAFTVLKRSNRNRVVLNSGKVNLITTVSGKQESILMKPGELVEVKDDTKKAIKKLVDPELYASFKDRKIQFDNTPLREIVLQLRDLYGLNVQLTNNQIASNEFTGTFPIDNPDLLLQVLIRTYSLKINKRGNRLILEPLSSASK